MAQSQSIDNKKLANLILSKKMATLEQVQALWPYCSPQKDIGTLLVDQGILPPVIYNKMVEFVTNSGGTAAATMTPQNAAEQHQTSSAANARVTSTITGNGAAPVNTASKAQPLNGVNNELPLLDINSSMTQMLAYARKVGASDLHLSVNNPVIIRRYGILTKLTQDILSKKMTEEYIRSILTAQQQEHFEHSGDLEFVYSIADAGRFRVTIMKQRAGWDLSARCIPDTVRSFEETGMPQSCNGLTKWAQGLVLVTGPACCGKTSSLTTLIEMINQSRRDHIITLESPIEYVFTSAKAQVTQRELGRDTVSQEAALRAALREDPDVIVIGELRDLSMIRLAVSAAETGHLVFATMNTISASRTIYRLIDSFPPEEQGIMRNLISESLRGVVSQQLVPLKDKNGLVAAFEVLLVNSAVSNMIRKDEAHQLGTAMITGKAAGMQLLDDSLRSLVSAGIIGEEEAATRSMVRTNLN